MSDLISQETIDTIRDVANEQIEHVLNALGIDIDNTIGFADEVRCKCPIHNGDNPTSFSYSQKFKKWRCFSHKCHEGCDSVFGLVQRLLSVKENKDINFKESVGWIASLLNVPIETESQILDEKQVEIRKLINTTKVAKNIKKLRNVGLANKEKFKPFSVSILKDKIKPSKYFLDQGFSEEILKKYYVGFCNDKYKPMYLRSYAPVLDDVGDLVIGVTGRIVYEKCEYCPLFHEQGKGCPHENAKVRGYSKWQHHGFNSSMVLYNYWYAQAHLKNSKVAIITEGPKDVWWLEQHGLHNGLGIFGLRLSECQLAKLIRSGVLTVVIGLDNDKHGIKAIEDLGEKLNPYFKTVFINEFMNTDEDIADISSENMNKNFVPYIKSLEYKNG
jgi:DNA primase